MISSRIKVLLRVCLALFPAIVFAQSKMPPLATVPHVDLNHYLGRWFEIAKYPTRFERECDRDTTATYSRLDNGNIQVINQCVRENGTSKFAKGKAYPVDATNAKLKVTFFWPFYGDYWIIDLDPQYRWAVVGEPRRKYLWILSRTPHLDPATFAEIKARLPEKGYDPGKLRPMKQSRR